MIWILATLPTRGCILHTLHGSGQTQADLTKDFKIQHGACKLKLPISFQLPSEPVCSTEGKSHKIPFNHNFPMVFPWFVWLCWFTFHLSVGCSTPESMPAVRKLFVISKSWPKPRGLLPYRLHRLPKGNSCAQISPGNQTWQWKIHSL